MYKYPMALTQQFRFCGNPFRIDLYKGCDFGCKYCFANSRQGNYSADFDIADFEKVEKLFYKAFEEDKETKNLNVELLRNKVPLHVRWNVRPFSNKRNRR